MTASYFGDSILQRDEIQHVIGFIFDGGEDEIGLECKFDSELQKQEVC